ncbi:hypothetical protein D3C84_1151550 [compost metagenome]
MALNFIAAVFTQEGLLLFGFDTFGNDLQVQFVPQRNHCGGDGFVVLVVGQIAYERLVDLESRDREAFQCCEAGVAGAEVVDREADPH